MTLPCPATAVLVIGPKDFDILISGSASGTGVLEVGLA